MAWKADLERQRTNVMYQAWEKMFPYAFPSFSLIPSGIVKAKERRNHDDIGATNMAIASLLFSSLSKCVHNSLLLPQ